jgi:hypothetical protein
VTNRRWIGVTLAAAALAGGCGTSGPSRPGEIDAGWDSVTLSSAPSNDALSVLGDGTVLFAPSAGEGRQGVISLPSLGALQDAVSRAGLSPFDPGTSPPGASRIVLVRGSATLGVAWQTESELTPPERVLVAALDRVRAEALGQGSERVEAIATERILSGYDARVSGPMAVLVRDGDGLINLLRGPLGGRTVALPAIDFKTEMLLAVFAGPGVRPGTQVQVDAAVSRTVGGYLQAPVTVYEPEAGCTGLSGASPFDLVRLRRVDLEVFFLWDLVTTGCRGRRPLSHERGGRRQGFFATRSHGAARCGQVPRAADAPTGSTCSIVHAQDGRPRLSAGSVPHGGGCVS